MANRLVVALIGEKHRIYYDHDSGTYRALCGEIFSITDTFLKPEEDQIIKCQQCLAAEIMYKLGV